MTIEEELAALDDRFVSFYESARAGLLEKQKRSGLILVNEDHMIVYYRSEEPRVLTGLRPPIYDKLKTLSHIPLSIFCLLIEEASDDTAISQAALKKLRAYGGQVERLSDALDIQPEIENGALPHRLDLYSRSLKFIALVLSQGRVRQEELAEFCQACSPDLKLCIAAAGKAQLEAFHAQVMRIKDTIIAKEDWESLRVVVMGPHMAHKDQNFLQYFSKLLHTGMYTDKRLVYFEGTDSDEALALMGTALLDTRLSDVVFRDPQRMHRDVMADVTAVHLKDVLGAKGHQPDRAPGKYFLSCPLSAGLRRFTPAGDADKIIR